MSGFRVTRLASFPCYLAFEGHDQVTGKTKPRQMESKAQRLFTYIFFVPCKEDVMRAILTLAFLCLSVSYASWAQDSVKDLSSPTKSPLSVSIDPHGIPNPDTCDNNLTNSFVLRLRNDSTKALRGYVVGVFYPDPKRGGVRLEEIVENVVFPFSTQKLPAPGAEWERTICRLPPGTDPTSVSVKVDLVGFEDGSKWGPGEFRAHRQ